MTNKAHYHSLEKLYYSAPINQDFFENSKIKVSESTSTIELKVIDKFYHAGNAMHGAVYFKLMDDAAYFASASMEEEYFILTKSYQIEFLRPVVNGRLKAIGTVVSLDEEETVAIAELFNDLGKLVGRGKGVFVKGQKRLDKFSDFKK
jgi:uncharacterized protein (TIGR00369 family)